MRVIDFFKDSGFEIKTEAKIYACGKNETQNLLVCTANNGKLENASDEVMQKVLRSNVLYMEVDPADCSIIIGCDADLMPEIPNIPVKDLEITRMLTISPNHVKESTYDQLMKETEEDDIQIGLPVYSKQAPKEMGSYGLFIYLNKECLNWMTIPDDLKPLVAMALANGCGLLCLDGDGPEYENLPRYDW